tara:strand:+ start:8685 stop:9632 length:948 start_codon:yes stop_codon:yes gene_type:complete
MKISKETKVGVLTAIAIIILAVGYNFIKGKDIFTSSNEYYGKYKKIEGLFKSNPVLVNGYKVGSVSSVKMNNETLELIVGIILPQDIKIPKNSIMKIVNNDMIGSKAIEIIFGDSKEVAISGDFFIAQQDQGIAQAVSDVLTPITKSVNSVLGNVDTAISGVDLRGTLKDASLALRSFKETADKLNKLLDGKNIQIANILNNVEQVTEGLRGLNPKIDTILLDLNKTSKDLNKVEFDQLANSIKILSKELFKTTKAINNKDGSLGMLVYDDSLYVNLNSTVNQLDNLLKDIEKYPRRYTGVTERQRRKGNKLKEK